MATTPPQAYRADDEKKQTVQPYAKDPDNLELLKLISELAGHGLSQQQVAELLGISPAS